MECKATKSAKRIFMRFLYMWCPYTSFLFEKKNYWAQEFTLPPMQKGNIKASCRRKSRKKNSKNNSFAQFCVLCCMYDLSHPVSKPSISITSSHHTLSTSVITSRLLFLWRMSLKPTVTCPYGMCENLNTPYGAISKLLNLEIEIAFECSKYSPIFTFSTI